MPDFKMNYNSVERERAVDFIFLLWGNYTMRKCYISKKLLTCDGKRNSTDQSPEIYTASFKDICLKQ